MVISGNEDDIQMLLEVEISKKKSNFPKLSHITEFMRRLMLEHLMMK